MNIGSFVLRIVLGFVFAFWMMNVLAVAVFGVPERYSGVQVLAVSLIVIAGGLLPVVVFAYLFRDNLATIVPRHMPAILDSRGDEPGTVAVARRRSWSP